MWSAPIVGFIIAQLSGPAFDGSVNQNALVFRAMALLAWIIVLLVGVVLTLFKLKEKKVEEVITVIFGGIAGGAIAWFVAMSVNLRA